MIQYDYNTNVVVQVKSHDIGDIIARDRAKDSGVYENEPEARAEDLATSEPLDNVLQVADGSTKSAIHDWTTRTPKTAPRTCEVVIDQSEGCIRESNPEVCPPSQRNC